TAGRDPAFAQRCAEMVGRCLLDQGSFDEAAQEFMVALELPGLTPEGSLDLRFQLGLAHEAAGRIEAALAEFERVYTAMPSYPDVAQKIHAAQGAGEQLMNRPASRGARRVDLHTHTTLSDGRLSPEELMALATDRGLAALAITDHDTLDALPRARAVRSPV